MKVKHWNFKHGINKNSRVYKAWCLIKERCFNPKNKSYADYGAKGITLESDLAESFIEFYKYIGPPPDNKSLWSIDRIENSKGYVRGNMRWATHLQQARNKQIRKDNSTGVTGVRIDWDEDYPNTLTVVATWSDLEGRSRSKRFSAKKLGLFPAFKMAAVYRQQMIMELNSKGAGYSKQHGK